MGKKTKKNKNKKQINTDRNREVSALFFALAAFVTAFLSVVPENAKLIGAAYTSVFVGLFGTGAYLIPFVLIWFFIIYVKKSYELKERADFLWAFFIVISGSLLAESIKVSFSAADISGRYIGVNLYPFFDKLLGGWLTFAAVLILFVFFVSKLVRLPLGKIIYAVFKSSKSEIPENENKKESKDKDAPAEKFEAFDTPAAKPNIISKKEKNKNENLKESESVKPNIPEVKYDSKTIKYELPLTDLLKKDSVSGVETDESELRRRAEQLRKTLEDFEISAQVQDIIPGPVVTRYDLVLAPGVKIQSITNIIENISLTMRTPSIRVVPVAEKGMVGVEVPNPKSVTVGLRSILETAVFENSKSMLSLALGKMTDGEAYVTDLTSMPHLLIAGATGSGKSVGIHTIILSILYKARPDEVKFTIIDPKRVEMPVYGDLPHLYNPSTSAADAGIITNSREAAVSLKKIVTLMEDRYKKFANASVRNIGEYNAKMAETGGEKEFYLVVIIDELADLMLVAKKEVEDSIQRLAQMARAVGIHLILATQRPSINVITGIIKANFPARLSFQTTSQIDSRVILDMIGAENLLGKGDMLFLPSGEARPTRLQGAFVSLKEIEKVVGFINDQNFPRIYEPLAVEVSAVSGFDAASEKAMKDLLPALYLIKERRSISQDLLKANFGGSARATNILSLLSVRGFISKPEGTNKWKIDFEKIDDYLAQHEE